MRRCSASLRQVSVIPIPMNLGQPFLGLDKGPSAIIDGGLMSLLGGLGWRIDHAPPLVVETGREILYDLPAGLKAKHCYQVGEGCKIIQTHVKKYYHNGSFPLILGGDHCIATGTIPAIKAVNENAAIVWVDAHADINTPQRSISGNMHGMPVAFLMGLVDGADTLPGFDWLQPCLKPHDVFYIGLRDVDDDEKDTIRSLGIRAYSMHDVDRLGIGNVMEQVLDQIGDRPIHLSFDIDAIDPFYAPHTGTAVTGGLTFREGNFICESLYSSGKLSSMELVEVDPSQHPEVEYSKTVDMALTLIGSAMGKRIL